MSPETLEKLLDLAVKGLEYYELSDDYVIATKILRKITKEKENAQTDSPTH